MAKLGRIMPRECGDVSNRHCEPAAPQEERLAARAQIYPNLDLGPPLRANYASDPARRSTIPITALLFCGFAHVRQAARLVKE